MAPTPSGPIRLPNGQLIGQPGSNGGVHRGPDKFPRRNAIRAVFLHAMAQTQVREQIDPTTGEVLKDAEDNPIKAPTRFAMVQDIVMAYQLIARHAASGTDLNAFLRMMANAHEMLQPMKDEAGEGRQPIPATFVLANEADRPPLAESERAAEEAAAPAPRGAVPPHPAEAAPIGSGGIVVDGQEYV